MKLAKRVNRISVSPTAAVIMEAERLKARGVDVVDFGPGEPDFPTPEHIKQAAIEALRDERTKYTATAGIAPLREAVCDWHKRELGSSYEPSECIVTVGGKHAIGLAMSALIDEGDEVIIPAPYWVSFPDIVRIADGEPVFVPTVASDGFRLRAEQLEAAITPRTRMAIINSPNNPTGAVIPPKEYERIYEVCRRHDIWLMADECYSHFTYGDGQAVFDRQRAGIEAARHRHRLAVEDLRHDRLALGLRPGAQAADRRHDQAAEPVHVQRHVHRAIRGAGRADRTDGFGARDARRIRAAPRAHPGGLARDSRNHLPRTLRARSTLSRMSPRKLGNGSGDSTVLAKQLLEREHVAVVTGDAFGAPGFLRFSYATSMERIEEGLRRLERFFASAAAAT